MARYTSPSQPSSESTPRNSHPLFWLLVIVALLTIVWSIYNRWASETTPASVQPPATGSPAHRESSRAVDARPTRPGRSGRAAAQR